MGKAMIPKKRLSTAGLFLFSGIACFLLNTLLAVNPFFLIVIFGVIYFALRSLLKIAIKTVGAENYNKHKWHFVLLFVLPYPVMLLWGHLFHTPADEIEAQAVWQVTGLFGVYVAIIAGFGWQIMRSLQKKGFVK
jgi:hypothetical protein